MREAIQEGKTRNASAIKRMLYAILKTDDGEKSFSAKALRRFITENKLLREAKIPKKNPLTINNAVLTIWLKDSPFNPDSIYSLHNRAQACERIACAQAIYERIQRFLNYSGCGCR